MRSTSIVTIFQLHDDDVRAARYGRPGNRPTLTDDESMLVDGMSSAVRVRRVFGLGHASAVLTMDTYADLFPDDLEMVASALDDAQRGALEQPRESAAD